jgi:hypothetical protein
LALGLAYTPIHLAAMITERYAITPCVCEYKQIIAEAIESHCAGLPHAAVLSLIPVIEGVGRKLIESRGLSAKGITAVFETLSDDCYTEVVARELGAVDEVTAMLEAFKFFAVNFLYIHHTEYSLEDNTNRHGPLHGAFTDGDYGRPINFYKIVGCLDFLCLVAAFRAHISWMAPDPTPSSRKLATYFIAVLAARVGLNSSRTPSTAGMYPTENFGQSDLVWSLRPPCSYSI